MKEMLGHDGPPTNYWLNNLITGEPLERCPVRQIQLADQQLFAEISRHRRYRGLMKEYGVMIAGGGIEDQPSRSIELIEEMDHVDALARQKFEELRPKNGSDG